jgi:hypothetical protein
MVLPEDSDLLKRLMNKRVDNLDELVNNLKDYFQKTEWMYVDGETRIKVDRKEPMPTIPGMAPDKGIPQVPEKPKKEKEKKKSTPAFNPVIPRSRMTDKAGEKSVKYFQNLYRKGLIRQEIYEKLMRQYGLDPRMPLDTPSMPADDVSPLSTEPAQPPMGEGNPEAGSDDEELLGLLNDTLADFSDDVEEAEPISDEAESSPNEDEVQNGISDKETEPVKRKRVVRKKTVKK